MARSRPWVADTRLCVSAGDVDVAVFERLVQQGCDEMDGGDPRSATGPLREALALWAR